MHACAFVFPGQGSQAVGMGAELVNDFNEAREVFDQADAILGFSMSRLCFGGPEEQLKQTEFTQPAVVVTSYAAYVALTRRGLTPSIVAGHSVGEYTALAAAGVLSFEDCLRLVRKRGQLMQHAGDLRPGGMAAVFGLSVEQAEELCRRIGDDGFGLAEVANINSPEQIVISGEIGAIEAGAALAKELNAKRYIPLQVSAAFHSSLMREAAAKMAEELDAVQFNKAQFPVVANYSGQPVVEPEEVRHALKEQIAARVRWVESVKAIIDRGVTTFVEVGPGTALAGMIRKISREVKVLNVADAAGVARTVDALSSNVAG
jgi:[acyl-carrier-protein] S-malonyltransferase